MADDPGQVVEEAQAIDHNGELLDEVLQQSSAQALRITHVDEKVSDVRQALQAISDDVAAIKLAGQTQRPSASGPAPGADVAHQLEHLEHETKALKSRIGVLIGVAAIQMMALVALMLFAIKPMPHAEQVAQDAPAAPAIAAKPAPAQPPAGEVATSENLIQNAPPAVAPGGTAADDKKNKEKEKDKGKKKKH